MKQALLWSDGDRFAMWERLPEKVRAEIIVQFARLVVNSLIGVDENIRSQKEQKR